MLPVINEVNDSLRPSFVFVWCLADLAIALREDGDHARVDAYNSHGFTWVRPRYLNFILALYTVIRLTL